MSLRAVFGFLALAGAGVGVSAGAIAFANTLATHQPPQASDLRRLADMPAAEFPSANAESKSDRLPVELSALTPSGTAGAAVPSEGLPNLAETTARAYAALQTLPEENAKPQSADNRAAEKQAADKQNAAKAKAPKPKSTNVLLNDAQIAALKQRLRLSPNQEQLWPEIEAALRGVLHQIYEANRRARGATVPVDTTTPEVERLKSAALPFLMQMRPDQKAEIISLARVIGMEKMVASL